jgi:4-hydroxybenzoate polyprenyltransferase
MRWHRPIPLLLSLWPTYWGLFLGGLPSIRLFFVFTLGVVLMRAAGCVVNDLFDQNYDRFVARTAFRPIASGAVRNVEAVLLLLVLLLLAASLLLFLNSLAQLLALPALFLALVYPLAKRFTYFPQLILGLAFNFGMIMAYAAVHNQLNSMIFWLYGLSIVWTLFYDTIYSLMDYTDDKRLGIKSPATFFDGRVYLFLFLLALCLIVAASVLLHNLHLHYAFLFALAFTYVMVRACWHLLKGKLLFLIPILMMRSQMPGPKQAIWASPMLTPSWREAVVCQKLFDQQQWFGLIIFLMILCQFLSV